jgi:hypothetical protein
MHSRLTIPQTVEWQLTPMTNPVTGLEEYATLLKPTGFTSQEQALCTTTTFRITGSCTSSLRVILPIPFGQKTQTHVAQFIGLCSA